MQPENKDRGGIQRLGAAPGRLALLLLATLILRPPPGLLAADKNSPALEASGEVDWAIRFSLAVLQAGPRTSVTAREKNGDEASFEGVALPEKCCGKAVVDVAANHRRFYRLLTSPL